MGRFFTVSAVFILWGCSGQAGLEPITAEEVLDEQPWIDLEIGSAVEFEVRGIGPGPNPEPTTAQYRNALGLARIRVEAEQKVVVAMRAHDVRFDSYLIVRDSNLDIVAISEFQAAMPGPTSNALVTIHPYAEPRDVFLQGSGGRYLAHSGRFTIDAVEQSGIDVTLGLPKHAVFEVSEGYSVVDGELDGALRELGERDADLRAEIERGYLVEDGAGHVAAGADVPLSVRNRVHALRDRINGLRDDVFQWHISEAASRGDVAGACLDLWGKLAPLPDAAYH